LRQGAISGVVTPQKDVHVELEQSDGEKGSEGLEKAPVPVLFSVAEFQHERFAVSCRVNGEYAELFQIVEEPRYSLSVPSPCLRHVLYGAGKVFVLPFEQRDALSVDEVTEGLHARDFVSLLHALHEEVPERYVRLDNYLCVGTVLMFILRSHI